MKAFAIFSLVSILAATAQSADLSFQIDGLRSTSGAVLVSVFDSADGFPGTPEKAVATAIVRPKGKAVAMKFKNLPPGQYAVAFIHDENNNGKLDTNVLGIPKEGIGFSNNPRIRFGAPSFADCAFEVKNPASSARATTKYY